MHLSPVRRVLRRGRCALTNTRPVADSELAARHRSYVRGRTAVALLGWVPLLVLYLFSHTRYLRPYVPESKGLAVVVLIVIPLAWLLGTAWAYRRLGPSLHRLRCPGCGARLVDDAFKSAAATGRCAACAAELVSPEPSPDGSP